MGDAESRAARSTVKRDVRYHLAEHEHLIAFDSDEDAEDFADWWLGAGEALYFDWRDSSQ